MQGGHNKNSTRFNIRFSIINELCEQVQPSLAFISTILERLEQYVPTCVYGLESWPDKQHVQIRECSSLK